MGSRTRASTTGSLTRDDDELGHAPGLTPSRVDLLEEAGLEQLLAVDREERVDGVADDAHDLAFAPGGVANDVALLEWAEDRAFDALDLEGAAPAGAAVTAEGLLEERLARGRVAVTAGSEGRSDVLELA